MLKGSLTHTQDQKRRRHRYIIDHEGRWLKDVDIHFLTDYQTCDKDVKTLNTSTPSFTVVQEWDSFVPFFSKMKFCMNERVYNAPRHHLSGYTAASNTQNTHQQGDSRTTRIIIFFIQKQRFHTKTLRSRQISSVVGIASPDSLRY